MPKNVFLQHTKKSIKMWIASVTLEIKAITRTWRESGDWVALYNIMNRGSTYISNKGCFKCVKTKLSTAVKDLLKQKFFSSIA